MKTDDNLVPAQRHDEEPRLVDLASVRIGDARTCAEINLCGFRRFELQPHRYVRGELCLQLLKQPVYG